MIVSDAKSDASDWRHQQGCTQWLSLHCAFNGIICHQKMTELFSVRHTLGNGNAKGKLYFVCYVDTLYAHLVSFTGAGHSFHIPW